MTEHIFKVQLPLSSNTEEGMERALVYDKHSRIQLFVPVAEVKHFFKPGELKVYVRGKAELGKVVLEERVKDRGW